MTDPSNLRLVLCYLYPVASPFAHYRVDDAAPGGPAIVAWDAATLGAQPTQAQLDAAELPAVQARRCAEIDGRTAGIVLRGFVYNGVTFNLDLMTQGDLTALYAYGAALTFPLNLTTADNGAFAVPDLATLQGLCGTALGTKKASLDAGRDLKAQVMAATTVAAVAAIADDRT